MKQLSIEEIIAIIKEHYSGYSQSRRSKMVVLCNKFLAYLAENNLKYSDGVAQDWLTLMMKEHSGDYITTMSYHRIVNLIISVQHHGRSFPQTTRFFLHLKPKRPATHGWQKILTAYLEEMQLEGKAGRTIAFSACACSLFMMYLETHGCLSPETLTRELCVQYEKEDARSNNNSKRAYQYRIRQFIRHLQRKGYVENTMEYAVKTRYVVPQKVVTILSAEQKEMVKAARQSKHAIKNRSYAMATLALYLGLRTVDVLSLTFSDILWKENSIKIVQHKTKVEIVLPLIAAVGNALVDYILNYRPSSKSSYVFVSHKYPYERLCIKANGYGSAVKLLGPKTEDEPRGLQIMRRTLAADLLRNNVNHALVSSFLGHVGPNSIDSYLHLDEKRMKECSFTLELIGMPEALK